MNRRGILVLAALVAGAVTYLSTRRRGVDFEAMSCEELWLYIQDPATGPLDRASAISAWDIRCAENFGPWPASGGTIPPKPPHN